MTLELVGPASEHLAGYIAALKTGWSPNTLRPEVAQEQLQAIEADSRRFLAELDDREGKLPPIQLPDGSKVPRLPGFYRWMWDGEFVGSISFRWQPGTAALPPTCLGHIGYNVVPWKQRRGYATEALRLLIPEIRFAGLPYVELTADVDNVPSQRVIAANGGVFQERFVKPSAFGGLSSFRFRIYL